MENGKELVPALNELLALQLPDGLPPEELREKLALYINDLMNHDLEKLVFILYRIDVDEARMRNLLQQREGEPSAPLIADLIIERQLQKLASRQKGTAARDIPEEDKW